MLFIIEKGRAILLSHLSSGRNLLSAVPHITVWQEPNCYSIRSFLLRYSNECDKMHVDTDQKGKEWQDEITQRYCSLL